MSNGCETLEIYCPKFVKSVRLHWDDFCLEIWFACCIYQLCSLYAFQWRVWNVQCLMHTLVKEGVVQASFSKPLWHCWNISTQWSPVAVWNQGTKWGAVWRSRGPRVHRREMFVGSWASRRRNDVLVFAQVVMRPGRFFYQKISRILSCPFFGEPLFCSLETETAGSWKEITVNLEKGKFIYLNQTFMTFGVHNVSFSGV